MQLIGISFFVRPFLLGKDPNPALLHSLCYECDQDKMIMTSLGIILKSSAT